MQSTLRGEASTSDYADLQPPENFRDLNVVPTKLDLFDTQPFLRPNIVEGSYNDVEHYLDVQFRLLREDCFGPLRDGLSKYKIVVISDNLIALVSSSVDLCSKNHQDITFEIMSSIR